MAINFDVIIFGILAGVSIILAIMMLTLKSPVHSALCLVGVMASLAVLFLLLHAYFLGVVQVVVYAGAVMVLFLYVIMFFFTPKSRGVRETSAQFNQVAAALVLAVLFLALVLFGLGNFSLTEKPRTASEEMMQDSGNRITPLAKFADPEIQKEFEEKNPVLIGEMLFSRYLLPFELTSLLLLAAIVGAVVLAKRSPGEREESTGGGVND